MLLAQVLVVGTIAVMFNGGNRAYGASDNDKMPQPNTPEYVDVMEVIVQVCVPNKVVLFEDVEVDLTQIPKARTLVEAREANGIHGHRTDNQHVTQIADSQGDKDVVRRWVVGTGSGDIRRYWIPFEDVLNRDGVLSAGGGNANLFGSTTKNQPVFEKEGRSRQKDYIALGTSIEVDKDGQRELVDYLFKLPANIPTDEFSNWQEPISREDKRIKNTQRNPTFWNLTHDKEMELYPVGENAPKMRFKLMSIRDYYDENRFWQRSQKAVAEKYYRPVVGKPEREKIYFVPKGRSDIPGC